MLKKLFALFLTFAKVGVMTFGGGYAMLPILQREVVEKKGWVTEEELADYFAIGQCTPGVIAVNTATFVGQKHAGIAGGIEAGRGGGWHCGHFGRGVPASCYHFCPGGGHHPVRASALGAARLCGYPGVRMRADL